LVEAEKSPKMDVPNLIWMAHVTDEEWEKIKVRYADFVSFGVKLMLKQAVLIGILGDDDDLKKAFTVEVMKDLLKDKSLPASLHKQIADELKGED